MQLGDFSSPAIKFTVEAHPNNLLRRKKDGSLPDDKDIDIPTDSYYDVAVLRLPQRDVEGEALLPKLEKHLADNGAAPKIAPDKVQDYKELFREDALGNLRNAPREMVDIYSTAEVKLVSKDFIEQYS